MHDIDSTQGESDLTGLEVPEPESFEYNFEQDGETEFAGESPFGEIEETELAEELLTIQSEEELDQFLGKLVKKAWRGVKKFAKSGVGRALGGALKGIAKKALPIVGGALGSFIPIPGVGTMIGRAAGTAAANLFEVDLEGLEPEEQEFEVAKRFVRLAGTAAAKAAQAGPNVDPRIAARTAVAAAARQVAPGLLRKLSSTSNGAATVAQGRRASGRWVRRGRAIVLLGV